MDMETLQSNFASLTDLYNTVVDLYKTDGIAQDDNVEFCENTAAAPRVDAAAVFTSF